MSNIFEREDIKAQTKFYRMTDIQLKELDINILRLDDITLFKKCLSQINSEEELLILGGLTNKIFRYFLDLELRYQGISSTSNPRNEIDLLDIEESKKVELRKVNSFLNGNSKLTRNPSSSVILDCFKELKNALEIFGRKNYILDSDIIRIEKFVTNKKFSFLMESSNILFDFVKAANKILHTEEHKEIKNYLAHPRQQITKQVTSISNDIL